MGLSQGHRVNRAGIYLCHQQNNSDNFCVSIYPAVSAPGHQLGLSEVVPHIDLKAEYLSLLKRFLFLFLPIFLDRRHFSPQNKRLYS